MFCLLIHISFNCDLKYMTINRSSLNTKYKCKRKEMCVLLTNECDVIGDVSGKASVQSCNRKICGRKRGEAHLSRRSWCN